MPVLVERADDGLPAAVAGEVLSRNTLSNGFGTWSSSRSSRASESSRIEISTRKGSDLSASTSPRAWSNAAPVDG